MFDISVKTMLNARSSRGFSLISVLFIGLIIVMLLLLGSKLVPAVVEYIAIERAVQKIKNEATTVPEIRAAFERHATIDDIKSISARDLEVTKENDKVVISYAYTYNIQLWDNVRLAIDFAGTTRNRAGKDIP